MPLEYKTMGHLIDAWERGNELRKCFASGEPEGILDTIDFGNEVLEYEILGRMRRDHLSPMPHGGKVYRLVVEDTRERLVSEVSETPCACHAARLSSLSATA